MMSGHCANPQTAAPDESHQRCARNGAGSSANPDKAFVICPCPCHHGDTFECGGCGRNIVEMPVLGLDVDGDPIYYHLDKVGRAAHQFCS